MGITDFSDANSEWIINNDAPVGTFTLNAAWNVAGKVTVNGSPGQKATLDPGTRVITVEGDVDINGKLLFSDNGTFDANGGFLADGDGEITFHTAPGAGGTLQLAATDPDLGSSFTENEGTVEYDLSGGGTSQDIDEVTYNNLTINGTDDTDVKTSLANLVVDGNLTVTNGKLTLNNIDLDLGGDFSMAAGAFDPGTSDLHDVCLHRYL